MVLTDDEILAKWSEEERQIYVVNIVFLCLYIILCVLGNGLVLIVYKVKMNQNIDDRYFIPWLALLDILACISRCAFELARKVNPVNFRGTLLCKLCWIPINITAFSSMFLLLVIAVQRYLKVCRPFGKQMTTKWKRVALGLTIVVSVCPSMVLNKYNEELPVYNDQYNVTGYVCDISIHSVDAAFSVFIVFAAIVVISVMACLIALNFLIWRKIQTQLQFRMKATHSSRLPKKKENKALELRSVSENVKNQTEPGNSKHSNINELTVNCPSQNTTENSNLQPYSKDKAIDTDKIFKNEVIKNDLLKTTAQEKTSHKFSYMFMLITLAFVLSYLPQFVVLFISVSKHNFWEDANKTEVAFIAFLRELNVVNNIVNPLIYGFYDRRFRESTFELFGNLKKRILKQRPTVAPTEN